VVVVVGEDIEEELASSKMDERLEIRLVEGEVELVAASLLCGVLGTIKGDAEALIRFYRLYPGDAVNGLGGGGKHLFLFDSWCVALESVVGEWMKGRVRRVVI